MSALEFEEFPKMARWSREVVITEKLDGTNAQVVITPIGAGELAQIAEGWTLDRMGIVAVSKHGEFVMRAGSRTKWITADKQNDNYGFAAWCQSNAEQLFELGEGKTRDEALIGRMMLAIHDAFLQRCRDCANEIKSDAPNADTAARMVLLQASIDRVMA